MSSKIKVLILITFLFVLMNYAVYYMTEVNNKQRIQSSLNTHLDKLQTQYNIVLEHQKNIANLIYKVTKGQNDVIEIFSQAWKSSDKKERDILREKLYNKLKDRYAIIKTNGVLQYHFVFPDNKVFLRMHKPSKYDDDLSSIRLDFKHTNQTQKISRGLSPGKTAHAFRNIYPLFDREKNYIGALDVAFPSEVLQDNLTSISKLHTHFLLNEHVFDDKAWSRDDMILKYQPSAEHKDYMLTMTKQHKIKICIDTLSKVLKNKRDYINKNIADDKKFSLFIQNDNITRVVSFMPINHNTIDKTIAWLVSYEKDDFIATTLEGSYIIRIISFFTFLLLVYFIYRIFNQKDILDKEVKNKTKELKEINENLEQKVTKEVDKNLKKELLLFEQSKMATMGTMIGNIAHQWRQPLSIISTTASGIKMEKEFLLLDIEELPDKMDKITEQVDYLSETVGTFRNFLKEKKELQEVILQERIKVSLSIVGVALKDNSIELRNNVDNKNPIKITMVIGELSQVIINIINNAKDILIEKNIQTPWVQLDLIKDNNKAIITIKDNGGGIPPEVLPKIFDEYFTTKDDEKGTGLGLHMSQKIIHNSLKGKLYAKNTENGAKFFIELPLS